MLGLAGPLSCLTDRALEDGLKGGRCHPSVSDYHITAVLGLAGPLSCLTDRALEEGLTGKVPSVSFGLPYNCCAGSGWAAKLLDRSGFGGGFEGGGRCHPSVSDYHITAVLGLAGPLSCLTDRALEEGLKGGKVPSVSFGLPYNCCAGSGWAAKLLDRSGSGGGFEGGEGAIRQFRSTI